MFILFLKNNKSFAKNKNVFYSLGSGWVLLNLETLDINIIRYNPLRASSHIKLPRSVHNRRACVNVDNLTDNKCFTWSVLSADKHYKEVTTNKNGVEVTKQVPRFNNPDRLENYLPFENELNMKGVEYPASLASKRWTRIEASTYTR